MAIKLNHTIVHARDKHASAEFYSSLFAWQARALRPFLNVETGNEVTLAFFETQDPFEPQHYAFLVTRPSSTRSSAASRSAGSRTGPIPPGNRRVMISRSPTGSSKYTPRPPMGVISPLLSLAGIGPVREPALLDAAEDLSNSASLTRKA